MKQDIVRKACPVLQAVFMSGVLAACDTHIEVPNTAVHPGHVFRVDGKAVPYSGYENSGKQAIAVIFHTYSDRETEGNGYAVYLWDMAPKAFANSLDVEQGTSTDITAYNGNANTNALHGMDETTSPMAGSVFVLWKYGQNAYILSVAQMYLLYTVRGIIDLVIGKCSGDPLPTETSECWYWTSTEVEGQQTIRAWLYSIVSGAMQETPKTQAHRVRPIITVSN